MAGARTYKQYGVVLEHILDLHNLSGTDRTKAKEQLHMALKTALKISSLKTLSDLEVEKLIEGINNFFPIEELFKTKYMDRELETQRKALDDLDVAGITVRDRHEKIRFLCELTGIPYIRGIANEQRLLETIKEWINE